MKRPVREILTGTLSALVLMANLPAAISAPILLPVSSGSITDAKSADAAVAAILAYRNVAAARWVISGAQADAELVAKLLAARTGTVQTPLKVAVSAVQRPGVVEFGLESSIEATLPVNPDQCPWGFAINDDKAPLRRVGMALPLSPGDEVPMHPGATFRITYQGPLQSVFYAFGETSPGKIRNLVDVPQLDIPIDGEAPKETITLVATRNHVPWLDRIVAALDGANGNRRILGGESIALETSPISRGLGANMQIVSPGMIQSAKPTSSAPLLADDRAPLKQSCGFTLDRVDAPPA